MSGPVKHLASILGATGEHAGECVLKQFLPPGFKPQAIFPVSDMEATAKPLAKGRYKPDLHVALGFLRQFDATQNSTQEGGEPCCDFHNTESEYIKGAASLDPYGPLFFVIAGEIIPALSPMLGKIFCNVSTPADVGRAFDKSFLR